MVFLQITYWEIWYENTEWNLTGDKWMAAHYLLSKLSLQLPLPGRTHVSPHTSSPSHSLFYTAVSRIQSPDSNTNEDLHLWSCFFVATAWSSLQIFPKCVVITPETCAYLTLCFFPTEPIFISCFRRCILGVIILSKLTKLLLVPFVLLDM